MEDAVTTKIVRCWSTIGVWGNQTPRCEKLKEVVHCRNCQVYWSAGRRVFEKDLPDGYLEQWTKALSDRPEAPAKSSQSVIYFRIGDDWLCISTRYFVEVSSIKPVHNIPHLTNKLILGLINIGGAIRLCFSLSHLLGIDLTHSKSRSARYGTYKRFLVIKINDRDFVFPVDEVGGVHRFSESEMGDAGSPNTDQMNVFVSGWLQIEDKVVACIDAGRLVHGFEGVSHE